MSALPGPANPIFYAQFNARGGWRTVLAVSGGYFIVLGGLIWFTADAGRATNSSVTTLGNWLPGLLGLQLLFLLLLGTFRVNAAIRGDINNKTLDSHRLMPASAFSGVAGYVLGAPIQMIGLAMVNFLLGLIAANGAAVALQNWIFANVTLGAFVLLIWIVTAQIAFASRGGFILLIIALGISAVSNGSTMVLLPGLCVLTCPLVGQSMFDMRTSMDNLSFASIVALLSQFLIGMIAFRAAMRKYRDPDVPAYSDFLGLLLVATWIGISTIGLMFMEEFVGRFGFVGRENDAVARLVASILCAMMLALIPLSSSAVNITRWQRNGGPTPSQRRKPLPTVVVAVVASILVALICAASSQKFATATYQPPLPRYGPPANQVVVEQHLSVLGIRYEIVESFVVILATMLAMGFLFCWAYAIGRKAWLLVIIWLGVTWVLPVAGDGLFIAVGNNPDAELGIVSTLSPAAALGMIWSYGKTPVFVGILFQCGMVLLPALLLLRAHKRLAAAAVN